MSPQGRARHHSRADRHSRLAWGVLFTARGARAADRRFYPMLLGEGWHDVARMRPASFDGEMRRTLLFTTRKQARDWCAQEQAASTKHSQHWRFRPVKVRETVTPV